VFRLVCLLVVAAACSGEFEGLTGGNVNWRCCNRASELACWGLAKLSSGQTFQNFNNQNSNYTANPSLPDNSTQVTLGTFKTGAEYLWFRSQEPLVKSYRLLTNLRSNLGSPTQIPATSFDVISGNIATGTNQPFMSLSGDYRLRCNPTSNLCLWAPGEPATPSLLPSFKAYVVVSHYGLFKAELENVLASPTPYDGFILTPFNTIPTTAGYPSCSVTPGMYCLTSYFTSWC